MSGLAVGALAAAIGAVTGSYLGTAALRATRREGSAWGRSHCDGCERPLGALQTLPLVSFVAARGACRDCGRRIDPIHPAVEAAGAGAALAFSLATAWPVALMVGVMTAALLAASVVDWRTRKLPDLLTLIVAAAGLGLAAWRGADALTAGLVAAAGAFLLLTTVRAGLGRLRGRQAMGFGDVKLIAALALWLGAQTPVMVAGAAILALVVLLVARPGDGKIPFGPMIAASGWTLGAALELGWWPR